MKSFSTALASGGWRSSLFSPSLRTRLHGDEGMNYLCTALPSGAMAQLKELYISRPSAELEAICEQRGIDM
eukprot:3673619-Prymnesium_polylepis.1